MTKRQPEKSDIEFMWPDKDVLRNIKDLESLSLKELEFETVKKELCFDLDPSGSF